MNVSVTGFRVILKRKVCIMCIYHIRNILYLVYHTKITQVNYNTMSYFLKTGLFTVISFASFLIPPDNVPGRIMLLITTLLAQANVASNALLKVPDSNQMSNV